MYFLCQDMDGVFSSRLAAQVRNGEHLVVALRWPPGHC